MPITTSTAFIDIKGFKGWKQQQERCLYINLAIIGGGGLFYIYIQKEVTHHLRVVIYEIIIDMN